MAKKLSYKHKYYTPKDYEEEIVCENRVVASTSAAAMEGDGGQSHQDSSLELDPEELNTSEAAVARIRPRHRGRQNHFRFTPRQIREMESFFKIWQNPNLAARYVVWTKSPLTSLASGSPNTLRCPFVLRGPVFPVAHLQVTGVFSSSGGHGRMTRVEPELSTNM